MREIKIGDDWTVPNLDGVGRRTLVQGAVWTVPVIVGATATPAAAASAAPTLQFTQPSYSGTACGVISGVQVRRTSDGTAPDAGKTIVVTLADGYTFAGGSTTYSAVSDANGVISLPDITVPATGGSSVFSATSDSLSALAPVSAPAVSNGHFQLNNAGVLEIYSQIPSDAQAIGYGYFLTPGGELWYKTRTTPVATGVTSAVGENVRNSSGTQRDVTTFTADGVSYQWSSEDTLYTFSQIPSDAAAVGFGYYLTPGGELWYKNRSTPVNVGVTSAVAEHVRLSSNGAEYDVVTYTEGGRSHQWNDQGTHETYPQIPADAKAVGYGYFLTPGGELWYKGRSTPVDVGVTSAVGENTILSSGGGQYDVTTYTANGVSHQWSSDGTLGTFSQIPSDAKAIGYGYYLTPSGDLWYKDRSTPVEVGVTSAVAENSSLSSDGAQYDVVTYTAEPTCS